jgi:protocatechuate 3,4-dioxygenase beta subunit
MTIRLVGSLVAAAVLSSAQVTAPRPGAPDANPDKPKEKCKVEGHVTNLSSGEPLKKTTLRLRMSMSPGAGISNPSDMANYSTTSDAEGKFLFEDVEPGRYTLSAERPGFVRANYGARSNAMGGTAIALDAGQHLKDLVFKLTPQGVIAGKVTDEDGDPVSGAQVQVYRFAYVRGKKQLQPSGASSVSADGSFMVANLAPGRYYLSASDSRAMMGPWQQERPGRRGPEEAYVTTYYANALDASSAAPVDVAAGAEIRGVEIRLRKARVFHISGKVVNTVAGGPAQNLMLMLLPKDNADGAMMFRPIMSMVRDREGSFYFNHVLPGSYVIQSNTNTSVNGERNALVTRQVVTVSNESIEDLVLPLGPGLEITGTIKVEGVEAQVAAQQTAQQTASQRASAQARRPFVNLTVFEGTNFNTPGAQSRDDGSFQLRGVSPDKYRVNISNLPDGTYVKSILFGGQDVSRTGLDLTGGSGGALDILLSPNAADVTGVVRNDKGETIPGVLVTLWSPGQAPAGTADSYRFANTDQSGGFRLSNLAPGEYRIVAWEDIEPGLAQDPDFRKRFESQAASVTLRDNSHDTAEVKLIAKDAIEAEAAKVR